MKKSMLTVFAIGGFAAALFALISCRSTKQESSENEVFEQQPIEEVVQEVSAEEIALASLKAQLAELKITVISSPKETVKNKPFLTPYKIFVSNEEDVPYAGFEIVAEFPFSKTVDSVFFEKEFLVTDKEGFAQFIPKPPNLSINAEVSFFPKVKSSDPKISELCSQIATSAPYKVRANVSARTGILVSIVDYSQQGKMMAGGGAQISTQALTAVLWKNGLTGAQNADFHDAIDADDAARIQNDAVRLVQGNSTFVYVIYGRVKYEKEVFQDEQGFYNVSLAGDVGALNIKTGEVLIRSQKSAAAKDKNQWNAAKKAQEEMALLFAEEIIYGL